MDLLIRSTLVPNKGPESAVFSITVLQHTMEKYRFIIVIIAVFARGT